MSLKKFCMRFHKGCLFLSCYFLINGCSTQVYNRYDGPMAQTGDNLVRYGSIGAAGAAGFFAGKEIGKSNAAGAVGAGVGAVGAYALNKYFDKKRMTAYQQGVIDGKNEATAEILNEKWKREAEYGLPAEGKKVNAPTYRTSYVPSRKDEASGVEYPGSYQTVPVFR
ncbi:hypothetical protein A7K73_07975 [Candidatus Methylacidiphilum fumarolicum]|uniref:Outer membrane protein or related peptidoglycan-associated (Lipo)protein n=4 Tax=Candidatus Methylacidiphilum fumarolicum TaxID=591154 RepID=I0K0L1_METFB|nr:hypothetical protein [Candidatus Methylacidiphilum fumarolicum]TFE68128.1 hypothetical protein A7K73_07975 [Candidatus Methylacidiphilum fumarolicum]TFE76934.1 hypothetical protein A7D33_07520 [Candidatus Methylacidiphilum fumarolicum]CAI9085760.1 Outer membrane protein or related peptidoglycan-associated (Lipo)protein [Candidatus Methylacidiphilum fumarolicum]CCG93030.1 Outer membrane protein or related peptidoglycan-associated (Lipo)protein [Methylacidiphilum fumariolicum SolV]